MQLELKRLQDEVGITFVVVTHDQEEALVMADRIALMNQGRIEQLGTAREIYEQPASHFAADFIGAMNFFRGPVAAGMLMGAAGPLRAAQGAAEEGEEAWLAVRPEKLTLHRSKPVQADNAVRAVVRQLAYFGDDVLVALAAEGVDGELRAKLPAEAMDTLRLAGGEPVWCAFEARHARLLAR